jgi:hypothetical protein
MSFHPLSPGTGQALLGTSQAFQSSEDDSLFDRRISGPKQRVRSTRGTLMIVIISAIIFVTIVAIYDVLRNAINNYYSKIALADPKAKNKKQVIDSTLIANKQALISSIVFATVCIITAIILVPILAKQSKRQ